MTQKLQASNAIMKESVTKTMSSKEMVDNIASTTASAIHNHLSSALADILFKTVIPSFERSCQNMFLQLSNTYNKGMDETCSKLEKQLQYRLKPEQDRLQSLIKEAGDASHQLMNASKMVTSEINKTVQRELP